MTQQSPTETALKIAREYLDIYGSDLKRWPDDARVRYGHLLEKDELQEAVQQARVVDELLAADEVPEISHDLKGRILEGYSSQEYAAPNRSLSKSMNVFLNWSRLVPAGALAGLAGLGFVVGTITNSATALTPEYEAYAYLEFGALNDLPDEEGALWDED